MPSIVVTLAEPTDATGVMHERIGCPSRCTVQAPHKAMPQPNFGPKIPSASRNAHKSGMSGSTSATIILPLMFKLNDMLGSSAQSQTGSDYQARAEYRYRP